MDIMQVLTDNLGTITGFLLSVGVIAAFWVKVKAVLKEVNELIAVVIDAMEDNSLTDDEVKAIIAAANDVPAALKDAIADAKTFRV